MNSEVYLCGFCYRGTEQNICYKYFNHIAFSSSYLVIFRKLP